MIAQEDIGLDNIEKARYRYDLYQDEERWVVESWNEPDGALLQVIFVGANAHERAEQYAQAKNSCIAPMQ